MPLRIANFDKSGLASLNRWADYIETQIRGVNTDTSFVNALGERNRLIAESLPAGVTVLKGAWNSSTTYVAGNQVTYSGNVYTALQTNTNQTPSGNPTYWQLIGPATIDDVPDGTSFIRVPTDTLSSTDLPTNGNFNTFPANTTTAYAWNSSFFNFGSPTFSRYIGSANSGPYAQTITAPSGSYGGIASQPFGVIAGQQYFVSTYILTNVVLASTQVQIFAYWYNSDSSFSAASSFAQSTVYEGAGPPSVSTWTQFSGTVTAPAGALYCILLFVNNADVAGGVSSNVTFSGTRVVAPNYGGNSSYRPLSNMLTATDAGSNATITIASWTNNVQGIGNVAYNGGSLTGRSYGTMYYVYMSDPDLVGGTVTYNTTTTKSSVLNAAGNFFIGSILTPVSGGSQTIGNNDGGAGAQTGTSQLSTVTGVTSNPSTGSTSYAVMPEMTITTTLTGGGQVTFQLAGGFQVTGSSGPEGLIGFFVDGVQVSPDYSYPYSAGSTFPVFISFTTAVTTASHTFDARWKVNVAVSPVFTNVGIQRNFQIVNL